MSVRESGVGGIGSLGELLVEFVCTEKDSHNRRAAPYVGPFASGAPGIFIDQAARVGARAIFAGSAFVSYNSDGSRDFVFNIAHSAASHFPKDADAIETLRGFGLAAFHISGSTLGDPAMAKAALDICRALHEAGVAISFDPNVRKELLTDPSYIETVRALLSISTFVLPSVEDAEVLFPGESFDTFSRRFHANGARYVVLKRGDRGCIGSGADGSVESFDAHQVDVVDPTGAGDCFCATFVALIVSGQFSFREALERANAAGALAVGKIGPMEGNSTLAEIEAFLERRS